MNNDNKNIHIKCDDNIPLDITDAKIDEIIRQINEDTSYRIDRINRKNKRENIIMALGFINMAIALFIVLFEFMYCLLV